MTTSQADHPATQRVEKLQFRNLMETLLILKPRGEPFRGLPLYEVSLCGIGCGRFQNSAVLAAGYSAVGKTTFAAGVEGLACLSKRRL